MWTFNVKPSYIEYAEKGNERKSVPVASQKIVKSVEVLVELFEKCPEEVRSQIESVDIYWNPCCEEKMVFRFDQQLFPGELSRSCFEFESPMFIARTINSIIHDLQQAIEKTIRIYKPLSDKLQEIKGQLASKS